MFDGLKGIRVIQTATVLAGPMAARLLADWGAEVIRVERPDSGYGPKGPDRNLPGYEGISFFSWAGIMHALHMPDMAPPQYPIGMGDFSTGVALAYRIMLALFIRERTGVGQEVDASLFQTGVYALSNDIAGSLVSGKDREKVAREDVVNPLAGYYETLDRRWVRIGMVQPDLYWSRGFFQSPVDSFSEPLAVVG